MTQSLCEIAQCLWVANGLTYLRPESISKLAVKGRSGPCFVDRPCRPVAEISSMRSTGVSPCIACARPLGTLSEG